MTYIDTLGQQAKVAGRQIAKLSTAAKNDLLNQVAKALVAESAYIIPLMMRTLPPLISVS